MKCKEVHSFSDYLSSAGLRRTGAREKILVALHTHGPMSADEITARIKHAVDRVSTYRTLTAFVRAGLVVPVIDIGGAAKYELTDHHRHHLTCTRCGVKEEIGACNFTATEKSALAHSKRFTVIQSHIVEFFGTCNTCTR